MKIQVQKRCSLDGHNDCIYALDSGVTSNLFYSAAGDGMVAEWDLKTPEAGQLVAKMKNSVYTLCFVPGKNVLLAGQNFEGIHFIDPSAKKDIGSVKISSAQIFDIKYCDGVIFIGSADGTLYVLDFDSRAFIKKIKLSDKSIRTIAINENLADLAVGLSDNTIRILDLKDYTPKYLINAHKLSVLPSHMTQIPIISSVEVAMLS
jgi:WD repeat-containing protein 61